jgi:hypothetical protein
MKKFSLIALLALLAALLNVAVFPDTGMARVFAVFGPENFVRSSKRPATEVRQFVVQFPRAANFTLHIFYGGETGNLKGIVPSALVTLNGQQVVTPNEFNRSVRYIKKPITLSEGNSLSVELRGKPGSGIRVVITGKNDEPQQFDFRDPDQPDELRRIQPDGSNLFGPDLSYDWTIVTQPEGGNAMLSAPNSSNPFLRVELPGEYSLELRIYGDSWESDPILVKLTAIDMLTSTYNDTPFVPVPVKTRIVNGTGTQYSDYSIQVGSTTYTAPAPANCGSASNSGFQVLVLDRASLAFKNHRSFNVPCGSTDMVNFLNTQDNSSLVIVSSLNNAYPSDVCGGSSACPLGFALEGLGGTSVFSSNFSNTLTHQTFDGVQVNFAYSLIGIPRLGQGQGIELDNFEHFSVEVDSKIWSDISGYFAQDVNQKWAFVYPEFVEIETHAATSATSNTIKVGGVSYVSESLKSGAAGGFQVLVLDKDTLGLAPNPPYLGLKSNVTFSTNAGTGPGSMSESEQFMMYYYLFNLFSFNNFQRYVLVIANIGTPISYKSQYFRTVAEFSGFYGGTIGVVNQLGTAPEYSTYSLVGMWPGVENFYGACDTVEASSTDENLRVVLHKDKQGWYLPSVADKRAAGATAPPDFSLLSVALQAPTLWPLPDPKLSPSDPVYQRQLAAYQYISNNVGEGTNNDIRSYYTHRPIDAALWVSYCSTLPYPATTPDPYFTQDDFNAMKGQLCGTSGEFNYLGKVNDFMDDMDIVLNNMQQGSTLSLANVYKAVMSTVAASGSSQVSYDAGIVIRGLLTAGTAIVKNPLVKGTMGIVNGLLSISMSLSKKSGGADYAAVTTAASSLASEMDNLWKNCKSGKDIVLDMVKSDWGKLQYVGNKFTIAQDQGGWKYGDTDRANWVTYITNSLEAYYFQSLLPAVWKIDNLWETTTIPAPKNFGYKLYSGINTYVCTPYCTGATSNNPSAYWVDQYPDGYSSWYVLEDKFESANYQGCQLVRFDDSADLRDVLFGDGDWLDSAGNIIGVKLNLSPPIFYERWLPQSVYGTTMDRVPIPFHTSKSGPYYITCTK